MSRVLSPRVVSVAFAALTLAACHSESATSDTPPAASAIVETPVTPTRDAVLAALKQADIKTPDVADIEYPGGKAPTPQQVALGKALFLNPKLSGSGKMSCATCHIPEKSFVDGKVKSLGDKGNTLKRNTPSLYNLAWNKVFTWDGEIANLEDMSLIPFKREAVLNLLPDKILRSLGNNKPLKKEFTAAFGKDGLSVVNIGRALAAYQRTIITRNAPVDRYLAGNETALDVKAQRGALLFTGKANCAACHNGANLTDESFHNIGVNSEDVGRGRLQEGDMFKFAFKTPGLRNVARTAPYMHDGSEPDLESVVRFYNAGGKKPGAHDPLIKPLGLTESEMGDLVAFLQALSEGHGKVTPTSGAHPSDAAPGPGGPNDGAGTAGNGTGGTVSGTFHFNEKPPKVGLLYFSEDKGLSQPLTIDQDNKQFLQQMVVASPGETITFKNSASISHNIYANDPHLKVKFDLGLALPESDFSKSQPVSWANGAVLKVGCKIHPNMRVYIASIASRYNQIVEFNDATTPVEIKAPAANLTKVVVWLPQFDPTEFTIKPGEHKQIALKRDKQDVGTLTLDRR